MAGKRRIEYHDLDDLDMRRAEANPKRHDDMTIAASVDRHGFVEPIVIDDRTGKLVAGHGRLDDLMSRLRSGEVVELPDGIVEEDGRWMAPVVHGWASENDAQAKEYLLVSNRAPEKGGWHREALAEMLGELAETDSLASTGFDKEDLDSLLAEISTPPDEPPDRFQSFDENTPTQHTCPSCGYEWSGTAGVSRQANGSDADSGAGE